jgi:hypothetical protein
MPKRFPYVEADPMLGPASALAYAPIALRLSDRSVQVSGLIDSGSALNVLPFDVGSGDVSSADIDRLEQLVAEAKQRKTRGGERPSKGGRS